MQKPLTAEKEPVVLSTFPENETNGFFYEIDWAKTVLGPIETWPASLHNTIRILLRAKFPMFLFWGKDLIFFYNSSYHLRFSKNGHDALGKPAEQLWQEGMIDLREHVRSVMKTGEASLYEKETLTSGNGHLQTDGLTYMLSPLYDEALTNPAGVLVSCIEKADNDKGNRFYDDDKKFQESEMRFNNLLLQSPMAIAILRGEDMVVESVNPAIIEVWGKGNDIVGKTLLSIMPEIAEQGFPQLLKTVYTTGNPFYGYEMKVVLNRSGVWEDVYFNFVYQPYRETEGRISGIMILATEVTEQVLAKKSVEESESRFSNLIREAMVGIVVLTGEEMKVEVVNAAYGRLIGRSPEALKGQRLFDVIPEADDTYRPLLDGVRLSGQQLSLYGQPYFVYNNGEKIEGFLNIVYQPYKTATGEVTGVVALCHDVTEQMQALQNAEESGEKLRIALEGGELGTFDVYPQTGKMYWSAKTKELFGLPADATESFELYAKALHPEDKGQAIAIADKAMAGENNGVYENEFRAVGIADGKLRWVRSKGKASFNEAGKPVRFSGIIQDVTRQKEAEQKLRESESRFRSLANAMPQIVWVAESNGEVTYYNDRVQNFAGITKLPDGNWAWQGMVHPEDIEPTAEAWRQSVRNKTLYEKEQRIRMKDGSYRWHLSRALPELDEAGNVVKWYGTATDIHDQKLTEQAIKESEDRFRTLAETLPQMIWVSDTNGINEYFSNRWKVYSGQDDAIEAWDSMTHPDDKHSSTQAYRKAFAEGLPFRGEVRLRNKAGEYRWHSSVAEPVKDSNGNIVKWVGALTDIHDQKAIAEKLEKIVAERTKELQRSNEDLQQFAHVASHDLKEPVRKVRTFSGRLREELASSLTPHGHSYLSKIEGAADRMYSMIDGVLAYSSLNAMDQSRERVDLNKVLFDVAIDLEVLIQQKKAILDYTNLPTIEGLAVLLHQLFYNLVNNSLKFAKANVPPRIVIRSETKGSQLIITVQDNGIGFDQQQAELIFQTFSRLNSKDKYEGTGLGLALCKKIVERHGGTITAESEPGEGATFEIVLPVSGLPAS